MLLTIKSPCVGALNDHIAEYSSQTSGALAASKRQSNPQSDSASNPVMIFLCSPKQWTPEALSIPLLIVMVTEKLEAGTIAKQAILKTGLDRK